MNYEIFNTEQQKKMDFILKSNYSKLSGLESFELKDLAIAWCYYSGKIEGNTYSFVETEALLKDNITSSKKYEDAKMLKNLYNIFISELEFINKTGNKERIDEKTLFRLHKSIIWELVSDEDAGSLRNRAVRITGTEYVPPKDRQNIQIQLSQILYEQENFKNSLERAIFLHCNIARIQPFIDGNKRTARLVESIVLMNNDIIPVYSTKDEDILNYRKALIHFYETQDYSPYADYFLDKQIEI
ncbi:MAG: Fic family protein [Chitinophagaceae bacterium]|jgi:Fic family protein|nr:Fic family protein [Chitinophagaceae bacterium]